MTVEELLPVRQLLLACSVPGCANRPWSLYRHIQTREHYHLCGVCSFRPGRDDEDAEGNHQLEWILDYGGPLGLNSSVTPETVLRITERSAGTNGHPATA